MADIDSIETLNPDNWPIGRLFHHIEYDEIVKFEGYKKDARTFSKHLLFTYDDGTELMFSLEFFQDVLMGNTDYLRKSRHGFRDMEKLLSLRPLSIYPDKKKE